MAEGLASGGSPSAGRRIKLALKRRLSPKAKRALKRRLAMVAQMAHGPAPVPARNPGRPAAAPVDLQPGEPVQVRPLAEIQATLDAWGALKGCGFLPEMAQYCGTVQRVLKPVHRAVDERDYRVKRFSGIVLLEGVICQGTADFGPCDRACFYFWREEWLQRAGAGVAGANP
jgi:hypothetical protein